MGNAVVHFEIAAANDGLLVAFYGEMFGWRLQGSSSGYTMIDTCNAHGINGVIARSQNGQPRTTFYVEVDDLQAVLDKANSLGGTTVMPVTDVGGGVSMAMFNDLDGLPVGLIRAPAEPSGGYASVPSAGSGEMLDWFEVMGSDAARTQRFYASLFDWTIDDATFPDYAVVDTGTERGIQGGLGGGLETRWSILYAWVADLDEAFSRAEKLGGSRVSDESVPELKSRARLSLIGVVDSMKTGAIRDPAGNVMGIFEFSPEAE